MVSNNACAVKTILASTVMMILVAGSKVMSIIRPVYVKYFLFTSKPNEARQGSSSDVLTELHVLNKLQ